MFIAESEPLTSRIPNSGSDEYNSRDVLPAATTASRYSSPWPDPKYLCVSSGKILLRIVFLSRTITIQSTGLEPVTWLS